MTPRAWTVCLLDITMWLTRHQSRIVNVDGGFGLAEGLTVTSSDESDGGRRTG